MLAQRTVDGKSNEITAFALLLDGLDITGAIVTADALHTQRGHAEYLTGRGAHYLFTVKGNQPTLYAQLKALPWRDIPAVDVTRGKGHGRLESRTVKVTAVSVGIGFPHARLAIQITRRRRPLTGRKWKTETVYAITDLDQTQIRPDEIADIIRAHWHIENKLHWVRDVTLGEDASQIRTGHGPAVMATLRNLAISVHRRHGATNIAAATRRVARHPSRAIPLLLQAEINTTQITTKSAHYVGRSRVVRTAVLGVENQAVRGETEADRGRRAQSGPETRAQGDRASMLTRCGQRQSSEASRRPHVGTGPSRLATDITRAPSVLHCGSSCYRNAACTRRTCVLGCFCS